MIISEGASAAGVDANSIGRFAPPGEVCAHQEAYEAEAAQQLGAGVRQAAGGDVRFCLEGKAVDLI